MKLAAAQSRNLAFRLTGIPVTEDMFVGRLAPEPEPWTVDAVCASVDGDLWFPEKGGSTREAKRICQGCPVITECLEYALANNERFGIWGGLSERQRRALQIRRAA